MILLEKEQELLRSKLDREINPVLIMESHSKVDTGVGLGKETSGPSSLQKNCFLLLWENGLSLNMQLEDCTESRYFSHQVK